MLLGDLNVLEPGHRPAYSFFKPFEYAFYRRLDELGLVDAYRLLHPKEDSHSWVGRTGDGYRYDHAFVSRELGGQSGAVATCTIPGPAQNDGQTIPPSPSLWTLRSPAGCRATRSR